MTPSTLRGTTANGRKMASHWALLLAGLPLACSSGPELPQDDPRTTPPCSEGYSECDGGCIDLMISSIHCGTCGVVCSSGLTCQSGTCSLDVNSDGTGGSSSGSGGGDGDEAGSGGSNSGGTFTTEVVLQEGSVGQCSVDGVVEASNAGFTGEGYLNSDNTAGASVEWAVNVGESGTYSLEFAYAGESGDRPGDVIINGASTINGVSFPATSSWTSWSTVSAEVALSAGENRVVLRSTSGAGLANIDSLKVTGTSLQALDCDVAGGGTGGSGTGGADSGTGGTGGAEEVAPCAANQIASCDQAASEIACHFGGDPGDYRVTVELGGEGPGDMVVDAEMHRSMLGRTITANGETKRFAFTVNVRAYEGQPVDPDQKGSSKGIPGLDVYIRGAVPKLSTICQEAIEPEPKVWLAGDSTVCDQGSLDFSGWGQHLPQFFNDTVSVANYADSGESSGSFLGGAKLWKAITAGWSSGDWVLIQLGHNDKNVTASTFEANLRTMVTQAKAAGVRPILVTPISRAGTALASQHVNSTGANLPQIIRNLGETEDVPVLDMTVVTSDWLETIDWKEYFALGTDRTHPNPRGAEVVAGFVAQAIRSENIELAEHLR